MHPAPTGSPLRPPAADERQWEAECGGKDPHASEAAAEAALAQIKKHARRRRTCWLNSYQCSWCGEWHIGNTRRKP